MKIFNGTELADIIADNLKSEVLAMARKPNLAIVAIDPDKRSQSYINAKLKRANEIGVNAKLTLLNHTSQKKAEETIKKLASDKSIDGIMIQLPLPKKIDQNKLVCQIPLEKDVDGLRFLALEKPKFAPATVMAIFAALDSSGVSKEGKNILVVGQGEIGKPLASILKASGIKVNVADENTKNLAKLTKLADILICAVGKAKLISADMVKTDVVVIDVGITVDGKKIVGDVDFDGIKDKAFFITPPVGGIGPVTVVMLLLNVVSAAKLA